MMYRILPIVSILLAIGIFVGYVHPTYTGPIAVASQEIRTIDGALAAADRFQKKEAELANEKAALPPEQLARLESFLPDGVDNVQLILDLNALAARSGIVLSDFNVEESSATGDTSPASSALPADGSLRTNGGPTDSLNLSLKASGTYASMRTFLAGVETSLRMLDLVELQLQDSATGVYTYQMTFKLHWLR